MFIITIIKDGTSKTITFGASNNRKALCQLQCNAQNTKYYTKFFKLTWKLKQAVHDMQITR